jgi:hypothetical protein
MANVNAAKPLNLRFYRQQTRNFQVLPLSGRIMWRFLVLHRVLPLDGVATLGTPWMTWTQIQAETPPYPPQAYIEGDEQDQPRSKYNCHDDRTKEDHDAGCSNNGDCYQQTLQGPLFLHDVITCV